MLAPHPLPGIESAWTIAVAGLVHVPALPATTTPPAEPYDWPKNSTGSPQDEPPEAARLAVWTPSLSVHFSDVTRSGSFGLDAVNSIATRAAVTVLGDVVIVTAAACAASANASTTASVTARAMAEASLLIVSPSAVAEFTATLVPSRSHGQEDDDFSESALAARPGDNVAPAMGRWASSALARAACGRTAV